MFLRPTAATITLLGLLVVGARAVAAADWVVERQIGPIEVRSETPLNGRLAAALTELPLLRSDLRRTLGVVYSDKPIELNVFATPKSYADHLAVRIPGVSGKAALFQTGVDRDRLYAVDTRNIAVDLRHECTHAFLHSRTKYVPLWLDEGIAEYFEVPAAERATGNPHLKEVRPRRMAFVRRIRASNTLPGANLERLEALRTLDDMQSAEYAEAWAWVHFMIHGPEPVRQVLRRTIADLSNGDIAPPLRPQLEAIVGDPEAALRQHIDAIR